MDSILIDVAKDNGFWGSRTDPCHGRNWSLLRGRLDFSFSSSLSDWISLKNIYTIILPTNFINKSAHSCTFGRLFIYFESIFLIFSNSVFSSSEFSPNRLS